MESFIRRQTFSNTTLIYSNTNSTQVWSRINLGTTLGNENYDIDFGYKSGIEDLGGRIDFDYTPNPNHDIKFGVIHESQLHPRSK